MKINFIICLTFIPLGLFGQETPPPPPRVIVTTPEPAEDTVFINESEIMDFPDKEAGFKGGSKALQKFIIRNVRYPHDAINSNIEGKVYLSFIVEKNGELSNIMVERAAYEPLDKEALRLISKMPKWKPGKMHGKKVRTRCRLPINFVLN